MLVHFPAHGIAENKSNCLVFFKRLIQVNVWQKPLQYCKVISLQLIKLNVKKNGILVEKNKVYKNSLLLYIDFTSCNL